MWLAIVGGAMCLGIVALFVFGKRPAPAPVCPACGGKLVNRGFVSWNGGPSGDLNLVTAGNAAPTEAFVAELREMAKSTNARMIGAWTLHSCASCPSRFIDERGGSLRPCEEKRWRELTRED